VFCIDVYLFGWIYVEGGLKQNLQGLKTIGWNDGFEKCEFQVARGLKNVVIHQILLNYF
jgi:hypothetical protein